MSRAPLVLSKALEGTINGGIHYLITSTARGNVKAKQRRLSQAIVVVVSSRRRGAAAAQGSEPSAEVSGKIENSIVEFNKFNFHYEKPSVDGCEVARLSTPLLLTSPLSLLEPFVVDFDDVESRLVPCVEKHASNTRGGIWIQERKKKAGGEQKANRRERRAENTLAGQTRNLPIQSLATSEKNASQVL